MGGKFPEATSFGESPGAEYRNSDLDAAETKELLELLLAFSRLDATDRDTVLEFARTMVGAFDVN